MLMQGNLVEAMYDYTGTDPEGESFFFWIHASNDLGWDGKIIKDAFKAGLVIPDDLLGRYLRAAITPIAKSGKQGITIYTGWFGPIHQP